MNTCRVCGCYLPENRTKCVSCGVPVIAYKTTNETVKKIYYVKVYSAFTNTPLDTEHFTLYQNAIKYAIRETESNDKLYALIYEGSQLVKTIVSGE